MEKIEKAPLSYSLWVASFLSIITVRILTENWLAQMVNKTGDYFFHHISYTFMFFLMTYVIFLGILMKNLKIGIKESANVMLWGYLIVIFPPLIDYILLKDKLYLSFYGIYGLADMPQRFFTFFGDNPEFGVTYGVRAEIALTVIFLFVYGYLKTKSKIKGFLLSLQAYVILFVLATFPSWVTIFTEGFYKGFYKIGEVQIVQLFFTSARLFSRETGTYLNALSIKLALIYGVIFFILVSFGLWKNYPKHFLSFVKNSRPAQLVYHLGMLLVGISLGAIFTNITWEFNMFNFFGLLNVGIAVILAWLTSVTVNDIYDKKIDKITNKKRPLIKGDFSEKNYILIGLTLFGSSILYAALVNPKVAFILLAYQSLAWIYSAWPIRLKRFPVVASAVSSLASTLILVAGFVLATPLEDLSKMPVKIMWLIIISLLVSLPIKDLKDIEGDRAENVKTIPVIFGEYWSKIIIGSGIFLSYFFSVIVINDYQLLPWAIILGGISFWILAFFSGKNKKIDNYNVIWWILGLLSIYIIVLGAILFRG